VPDNALTLQTPIIHSNCQPENMEEIMAPDGECNRLRPPLQELLPQTQTMFVLPPISTIRKPPSAYCHPPSHTSGPPPGFFHYTSATAPILHPRPLFFSTYAQQLIPNQNPANAELEAGPASAAQELLIGMAAYVICSVEKACSQDGS
jgi:hypothetical protein